jgi:transposase InsO family protein
MPWIETAPMNEKVKFISAYLNNEESNFQTLCARFGISCKTGYKYVKRYKAEGIDGLKERSRAPHIQANRIPLCMEEAILELKSRYPTWGAKKILSRLEQDNSHLQWPARSTIDDLFKRHHLVVPRKRKRQVASYKQPFLLCEKPNDIWSIDYKGQFALGNKKLCYPLTISDNFSRYLLGVRGSKRISTQMAKQVLSELFVEFGLPKAIRSDNGTPFAGNSIGGLSLLSVWLIKLGIIPERIRKGHPEENGRHERMHFTLQQEAASPPAYGFRSQQNCFDRFRQIFNEERPHEGIDFNRPAWLYEPSVRAYTKKPPKIEYDEAICETRLVRPNGHIKWNGKEIFISKLLIGEYVALRPHSQEEWALYFSFLPLGIFNERMCRMSQI